MTSTIATKCRKIKAAKWGTNFAAKSFNGKSTRGKSTPNIKLSTSVDIGGFSGGVPGLSFSFSHTFSAKSAHIGGPRPPTGNPGSATVQRNAIWYQGNSAT